MDIMDRMDRYTKFTVYEQYDGTEESFDSLKETLSYIDEAYGEDNIFELGVSMEATNPFTGDEEYFATTEIYDALEERAANIKMIKNELNKLDKERAEIQAEIKKLLELLKEY